jgi:hypothetical protein
VGGSRYRDLDAYRQATAIADALHAAVHDWSALDAWSAGIQLLRAGDSIGANIAEAYGRYGYRDQRHFLYIARGLLKDETLQRQIGELIRTLNGLIRKHREQ